ncbi:hypothetical protein K4A83_11265 [Spirulina subsalsa FACHB-351]|uniref:Uncharacterized protein n=1 Tax=Spirulina subsalsa FACHB-351 TaxID=234711 RepID=A0ABT3L6N2_9CYAN|nr:hypothetical protein [Spirulina subsalsa]MCW6036837.1 hypothetical protein [Spirulina subsalsa FACHB-351]
MTTQTDDMKPRQVQDLPALVAAADEVQFEIHGTIGEWYLRVFELKDDEIGKSSVVGSYVLSSETGQPRPYAQLEALILKMNRATGTNDYDFAVYQYPDHGHSPGDAAPVMAERAKPSPMKEIFDKIDAAFAMTIDDDRSTVGISRADWAKVKTAVQEAERRNRDRRGDVMELSDCLAIMELYAVAYSEGQVPEGFDWLLHWIEGNYPELFELPEFSHLPRR